MRGATTLKGRTHHIGPRLGQLVHPSIPLQERRAAAVSFLNASRCCLDDDFSLKLRAHFRTPEDILENPMAVQLLCTTLEGLVGSTSHIEDAFAHMRRHVQAAWRAPSMASLASCSVDIHFGGGVATPRISPEDNVPKRCSLQSMEPLREWFCKGSDMTSPAEYEAALCQLEENPTFERKGGRTFHWKV